MIMRFTGTPRPGPDDLRRFHNARLIPPTVGLFARPKPRAGMPASQPARPATRVPTWLAPPQVFAPAPVTVVRAPASPVAPMVTPPPARRPVRRATSPPELPAQPAMGPATLLGG